MTRPGPAGEPLAVGGFMAGFDRPWWMVGGWSIEQVWVRRDARSPWVLDVPFTPDTAGRWTHKRHLAHTEDLEGVTWPAGDGLRYARPEVTLMFKAAQAREKDRRDADVTRPLLDASRRRWLSDSVALIDPVHPWMMAPR